MIFNDVDLNGYFKILNIDKSIIPPTDIKAARIPYKVGELDKRTELGSRIITSKVELKEKSRSTLEEQYRHLASILYTEKSKKLILDSEIDKYYLAKISSVSTIEEIRHFGVMDLSFICLDPLAYSKDKIIVDNIHNKTIINQGTYETKGQMIVHIGGDTDYLKVTLQNNGEFIYLEDDFKTGNEVLIDLENELVKKNGNLIMNKLYLESDFFTIPRDEFEITLSSGVGRLEFRERWL